ncbi:MAG: thiol:disulfide interchange protein DsbA/DsbL [Rhodocyclaceae bacterium]|nr:thiol:disulfide interchange protein DsbA/DsbL [Rhodocyclaceae bacterium]
MRFLQILVTSLLVALSPLAVAAEFQAGADYTVVSPPQQVDVAKGKIEIIEFFWYGCPHCYHLEPALNKWRKTLPADVVFRRVPAVFSPRWALGAKTYFALEAVGQVDRLHGELFDAFQGGKIGGDNDLFDWVAKNGVDRQKFADAFASFSTQSKVTRAQQTVPAYGINGVPAMAIGGKYVTSPAQTGGEGKFFAVVDSLIAKIRAEQGGKK